MKYPFFCHGVGKIDLQRLEADIRVKEKTNHLVDDWYVTDFYSDYLLEFVEQNFFGLKVMNGVFGLSYGTNCLFHVDGDHRNLATHRVLIPLDSHFQYHWFANGKMHTHRPEPKEVLVFNNMIPHRFRLDDPGSGKTRVVITFNLVARELEPYLSEFSGGNPSSVEFDRAIRRKLGIA